MKKKTKEFLKKYVFFIRKKIELRNILLNLENHVNSCYIHKDKKKQKLEKILSILDKLNSLDFIPLKVHEIGLIWLELCCKKLILDCGYTNIENMLNTLNLNIKIDNNEQYECSNNLLSYLQNNKLHELYSKNIKPINCVITKKTNKKSFIKFTKIRPSLEELEGKLLGIFVEINRPQITIKIMGILTPDLLRYYRELIPVGEILEDLKEKYFIEHDVGELLLNCISYRDLLTTDTRQITNRLKQLKEKYDFYKKSDLTILLNEFHFLDDSQKLEMITLLIEFGIITKANYLVALIPVKYELLDIQIQKYIDNTIKLSKETNAKNESEEVKIEKLLTSEKNKSKALEKLKTIKQSNDGDSKAQKYLDGFLKDTIWYIKKRTSIK